MTRFDEEPDADPHGECAAEIHRLQAQVEALTAELESWLGLYVWVQILRGKL